MKKFIINTSIIVTISTIVFLFILSFANGYTDPFYIRFTTPKQNSLILGTSRAAQALQPQIFQQFLDKDIFNYAFTIGQSPYGPVYYESIKRKLKDTTTNGLFIVAVNPWSISSITENPNDINNFRENDRFLAKTTIVDSKPNFQYIFNSFSGKYAKVLTNNGRNMFLHDNGWLEVNVKMDSIVVEKRIKSKVKTYREKDLPRYKLSQVRLAYLEKTIKYLKEHGKVYLVRLPIHSKMMEIENELMPDFDEKIKLAINLSDGYLDITPKNDLFDYTDGNHLYKTSGEKVSTIIANWIAQSNKTTIATNSTEKN